MKILQINTYCGYGSTGRVAVDIADSLAEGDECTIAYGYFNTNYKKKYNLLKWKTPFIYKVKLILNRIKGRTGYTNKFRTKKFLRWIDEYNPDVIHLHNIHGDYLHIGTLFEFLKKRNFPVVWTFHDCWPITGRCAYFDYNGCSKWKNGCHDCQFKKVFPITYFFDSSKKEWYKKKELFTGIKNLTIVTPSHWLANLVKQSFLSEYHVKVIHNGIDLSTFKRDNHTQSLKDKYNIDNQKILLGVAGAWSYRKGLNYFIELSKLISDKYKIVLIGLSKKQIKLLPLSIIGIEHTESISELVKWYSCATVYLNPTLDDNYPTTNIEAQACGAPIITFRTGGSPESVQNGMVVNNKTVKDLYDAIEKIANSKDSSIINPDFFSKETFSQEYRTLYKNVINI